MLNYFIDYKHIILKFIEAQFFVEIIFKMILIEFSDRILLNKARH